VALVVGLLLAACSPAASTPRSRVASDLGCTTAGTGVRKIDDGSPGQRVARWQVTGCGRSAIYLCTTPVRDCWREGEIQATSAPSVP